MVNSNLVDQIKSLQRADQATKEAWWAHCDGQGNGVRDPNKHDDAFLQTFLTQHGTGVVTAKANPNAGDRANVVGADNELVQQIKTMQKGDPAAKGQWWAYVDANGEGVKDPCKHPEAFLQTFLDEYNAGTRYEEKVKVAAGPGPLGDWIKTFQRKSAPFKNAWQAYCGQNGYGVNDPMKHDARFIGAFLDHLGKSACGATGGGSFGPGMGGGMGGMGMGGGGGSMMKMAQMMMEGMGGGGGGWEDDSWGMPPAKRARKGKGGGKGKAGCKWCEMGECWNH